MMKICNWNLALLLIFLFIELNFSQGSVGGWDPEALENANNTIKSYVEKDPELETFFDKAYGYAVFPTIGKGAIGIGGAHGRGTVFEQGNPVGKTSMTQITIGLQFGDRRTVKLYSLRIRRCLIYLKQVDMNLMHRHPQLL